MGALAGSCRRIVIVTVGQQLGASLIWAIFWPAFKCQLPCCSMGSTFANTSTKPRRVLLHSPRSTFPPSFRLHILGLLAASITLDRVKNAFPYTLP